jgi:cytochrome bd-type quinol oxidase subunit 1
MEYPFFDVPKLGGGFLVAIVAIVHVAIAHFAVGAGIFMAVNEYLARRRGDELLLGFLQANARMLIVFAFIAGAVTGVGIWVTIGLVSPAATSALIHLFVWAWAIEWCFFAVEIVSGYVYYYGWHRLTTRRHLIVGGVYALSAWMSLFWINGIITFMLTPGAWSASNPGTDFWTALFNPTFWPSLALRTISCLALAGLLAIFLANLKYSRDDRRALITRAAYFLMPLIAMPPCAWWYFRQLPQLPREMVQGAAAPMMMFFAFGVVMSVILGGYAYFIMIRRERRIGLETSIVLLAVAFVATGSMEFVREGIRKPYLIYGHLYSNGIFASQDWADRINRDGILRYATFAYPPQTNSQEILDNNPVLAGSYVFTAQCRICHETTDGTNAIRPLIRTASREWLRRTTAELHRVKNFMPPFFGTAQELDAVVEFQYWLAQGDAYTPEPTIDAELLTPFQGTIPPPDDVYHALPNSSSAITP